MAELSRQEQRQQRRERMEQRQQQARQEAQRRALRGRLRLGVLAGLVVLAVGLLIFWVARETTAPLPGVPVPDEGRGHVDVGAPLTYRNNPPSSGIHYTSTAPWRFFDSELAPGLWVHNLEHGGIVVLYNCPNACEALKNQLRGLYNTFSRSRYGHVKLVVAPDDSIEAQIVALAWNRQADLESFDEDRLRSFYEAYVDRGPEDAP